MFKRETDIDRAIKASKRFAEAHKNVAADMGTGYLLCANCKIRVQLDETQVENYLREGWPMCCKGTLTGGTMRFYRHQERA